MKVENHLPARRLRKLVQRNAVRCERLFSRPRDFLRNGNQYPACTSRSEESSIFPLGVLNPFCRYSSYA